MRTWQEIIEDEFSQKPRDEFVIWTDGNSWVFMHQFRCIDPLNELPEKEAYLLEKRIEAGSFADLEELAKEYLEGII